MKLNNGLIIPQIGVGTWTLRGETARQNVLLALKAGFRHIDTAQGYENEAEVGQGIADSGVPRSEIFITTKVATNIMREGQEAVQQSIDESLAKLKTDYIDLLLIHWPVKDCVRDTWQVMENYVRQGKVRSIGVSNFNRHHLDDLLSYADIRPKCRGAWWSSVEGYRGNSFWFMRTSGYTSSSITYVCDFGYLYNQGTAVTCDDAAVLPAITIDLEKANYQKTTSVESTDVNN